MKIFIQDLDAKGGQLKETGEKLALTSARCLQANIYEGDVFKIFTMFTKNITCGNQYL